MDEPCFGGYLKDETNHFANMIHYPTGYSNATYRPRTYSHKKHVNKHIIKAPLNQQVIEWAMRVHGLYVSMFPEFYNDGVKINWQIRWVTDISPNALSPKPNGTYWYGDKYPTYHAVMIAVIDKLIELIQYKNLNGEFQDPRGIHDRRGI